jgi:hypothetical protein
MQKNLIQNFALLIWLSWCLWLLWLLLQIRVGVYVVIISIMVCNCDFIDCFQQSTGLVPHSQRSLEFVT